MLLPIAVTVTLTPLFAPRATSRMPCAVFKPASPVLSSVFSVTTSGAASTGTTFKAFLAVFRALFAVFRAASSLATEVITTANSSALFGGTSQLQMFSVVHRFLIQVVRSLIVAFDRVLRPGLD